MVTPQFEDDDVPADPSLDRSANNVPFEHDDYWVEMPGSMWTPALEHKQMPLRDPTPGELADRERKRGGSEDEVCPVDPLLENLDFTSEYVSPKKQDQDFQQKLKQHYKHSKNILKRTINICIFIQHTINI